MKSVSAIGEQPTALSVLQHKRVLLRTVGCVALLLVGAPNRSLADISSHSTTSPVVINHVGDIAVTNIGIWATTTGPWPITINQAGNITSADQFREAVRAENFDQGNIDINVTGDVTGGGIGGNTGSGNLTVVHTGVLRSGISAHSTTGNISVIQTGNTPTTSAFVPVFFISSSGPGSGSLGGGTVRFENNGNITTTGTPEVIVGVSSQGGEVTVINRGNIDIPGGPHGSVGIRAATFGATVTVIHDGVMTVGANSRGIWASSELGGQANVIVNGTISAAGARAAIWGFATDENVTNNGSITGIISLGDGQNTFRNSSTGSFIGNFMSGTGRDTIENHGQFIGNANLGGGGHAFTNTGTFTGNLFADGNNNLFNSGAFTGDVTIADGTTIVTGSSPFVGTMRILSGTLQIGDGSATGSIVGNVVNNGVLSFNRSDSVTYDGIISGPGAFQQNGTGTTALTGTSTYTGATAVNAGALIVNGSIAFSSMTTVNAGGTLGGNGTVGNTTINGGTLSPGNSIGTLTVQGNLVFTAAASYMVEVSPANADRTNVTGTATLGGAAVKASFAPGTYVAKRYTIVNAAGGVIGTFGGPATTDLPKGFQSSLSYDANNAYLDLSLFGGPNFGTGLNVNQTNVANALTGFFNRTGGIPIIFGTLTPAGLTQVSGELPTAAQQTTFDAMNLFLGLLTDPFVAGRGNPVSSSAGASQFADENDAISAYAANGKVRTKSERDAYAAIYRKAPPLPADPYLQRWSVWAAGYGGSQTTDGNTVLGSNNTRSSIGGVAVGADYRFSPNTLAGFALAGGATNFSVNGLGSGRSDLFQAGAFLRHTVGPAYLSAALAYGWQDITTDRTVTVAGTDVLRAKFKANAFSGRVEGGYRFVTPWMAMGITPYAAGQFTTFDLPAYAEQAVAGANTFALTYGAKDVTASRSELGLRSDKSFAMQDGIFTLRGRAAWAHNFNTDRSITPTFQTLPGASFVVNGARQASDSALVTGSAEMKWLNGFSLAGTFEGEFSNVTASYAGKGVVRYAW